MHRIGVSIIARHPLIRLGLVAVLEREAAIHICAAAPDVEFFLERPAGVDRLGGPEPAVVVVQVPRSACLDALLTAIRRSCPAGRPVLLIERADPAAVQAARRLGIDLLDAGAQPGEIVAAVLEAGGGLRRGERSASLGGGGTVRDRAPEPEEAKTEGWAAGVHPADLTPREREVLDLLARRWDAREIALALGISYATARTHVRNVYAKCGVHSRAEAAALARLILSGFPAGGAAGFGATAGRRARGP